jgi:hypothetical protein
MTKKLRTQTKITFSTSIFNEVDDRSSSNKLYCILLNVFQVYVKFFVVVNPLSKDKI